MSWKLPTMVIVSACLVMHLGTTAHAAFEAANGKVLAEKWCASCHLVSPDQAKASADAPPFAWIANRSDDKIDRLAFFLLDPHPVMPNFDLSRDQITDLVAYIRGLKE